MAISRFAKVLLAFVIFCLSSCCAIGGCPATIGGDFLIVDWSGGVPKALALTRYKKNSDFRVVEQDYRGKVVAEKLVGENGRGYLSVKVEGYDDLPLASDYKIVLDGRLEYRVFEIVPSNSGPRGCPLESYRVNSCPAKRSPAIALDGSCGEAVRQ